MKLVTSYILIQLFWINITIGQSIPSFWMNIYKLENYFETDNDQVEEIIVNITGYYSSGKSYKEKWIYEFLAPNKCQGKFFKNGDLKSDFTYEFDNLKQIIKIKINTKIPLLGWEVRAREFEFVNKKRISEKHFDENLNLVRSAFYHYDSLEYLTKLEVNNGFETAEYDLKKHSYIYKIFNEKGELILEEINFANRESDNNIENENGDLIRVLWPTANPENHVYHLMEYKYDKKGNWIKRERYIEKNGVKKIRSKIKRKIKYKN